ncbi:hypothetical protein MKS78_20080 [Acinetobacter baumannii]
MTAQKRIIHQPENQTSHMMMGKVELQHSSRQKTNNKQGVSLTEGFWETQINIIPKAKKRMWK